MMKCKKCQEQMCLMTTDEGGGEVYWCWKCGSLGAGGELDEFWEVGIKPKDIYYGEENE